MVAKMLISVIDDAYTDAQMLMAYAEEAKKMENMPLCKFFKECASRRMTELEHAEEHLRKEVEGMYTDKTSMDAYIHCQWAKYREEKLTKMKEAMTAL